MVKGSCVLSIPSRRNTVLSCINMKMSKSAFSRMIPTLFGAKQQMQRQCDVLDGEYNTE
jgi:hypothetical protein